MMPFPRTLFLPFSPVFFLPLAWKWATAWAAGPPPPRRRCGPCEFANWLFLPLSPFLPKSGTAAALVSHPGVSPSFPERGRHAVAFFFLWSLEEGGNSPLFRGWIAIRVSYNQGSVFPPSTEICRGYDRTPSFSSRDTKRGLFLPWPSIWI